ncbi:hypothetical protein ACQ86O_19545 [Serratia sp. L9]|uniref:hypothetical protein n=1 Tax=Serratia sp. L9 TaxID=3423946 RepID=UPI003D67F1E5
MPGTLDKLMTSNAADAPVAHRPLILIACMLAMFMSAIEATIVATAMPTIIGDLGAFRCWDGCFPFICWHRPSLFRSMAA